MATTIITKNGSGAPTTDDLSTGELAIDLTNKRLYSYDGTSVIELGVNTASSLDVTGTLTADDAVIQSDGATVTVSSADYEVALLGRRGSSGVDLDKGFFRLKDTGTTKVAIDTAGNSYFNGGNVGIGTDSPTGQGAYSRVLHVHGSSAGSHIKLTDAGTGSTAGDGTDLLQYGDDFYIIN